ncbi:FAD-dependent oxidoreductase [Gracilibacillus sp. YIM 98692]|uniref:NAD(P)/FAD-dependent oxidoreductase n=1 Tax=Gracilibacillus sp. YIM 98692 TaxID=2663532 RepID=UPI0013D334D8|nr:FAD-dependent oxidoreductase [Gracilibacillus sp. YIM 98692]
MNKTIIIGAGIVGTSTAYHLAKQGVEVTLVDADFDGRATTAAAGIVCPWVSQRRNQSWYYLARNSARFYPELVDQLAAEGIENTGYKRVGTLVIRKDAKRFDKIHGVLQKRKDHAPEMGSVTQLSPEETKARIPIIDDGYSSIEISGGARVHGEKIRQALLKACHKYGVKQIEGQAELIKENGQAKAMVNDQVLQGNKIILAVGAWFSDLIKPLGMKGLIRPQKAQITEVQMKNKQTDDWPVIMPGGRSYMVPAENGSVVAGTTHEDNVGYDTSVTPGGLHQIFTDMLELAPDLANSSLSKVNVGFRPVAPHYLPVYGSLPEYENILVANGLGSSGLTTGPYLGKELANLAVGKQAELDLENYPVSSIVEKL